jgi:hypothetical protein
VCENPEVELFVAIFLYNFIFSELDSHLGFSIRLIDVDLFDFTQELDVLFYASYLNSARV